MYYDRFIEKVLLTEEQIQRRVAEMGQQLTKDYKGKNPIVVSTLKGSSIFHADLVRKMEILLRMDFLAASSYRHTESTGVVRLTKDLKEDITDQHVILLEDIIDTGLTIDYLVKELLLRRPASLQVCTFLDKPCKRKPNIMVKIKYKGFEIGDVFAVGYGLDLEEDYRQFPIVGVLKPEFY